MCGRIARRWLVWTPVIRADLVRFAGKTRLGQVLRSRGFPGTRAYWERRYASGGTSGSGSYGLAAQWKAAVVNGWVRDHGVESIVDFGCGDGNQLSLANYPRYLGLDVSHTAVQRCTAIFATDPHKSFTTYDPSSWSDNAGWFRADLALSLEVIFHLVEIDSFELYMGMLFDSAQHFVVICSSDFDGEQMGHEKDRQFSRWIREKRPAWQLLEMVPHPTEVDMKSDLYLYHRGGR